ncbi:EAL domain-containing protein [Bacillus sp. 1NLA3E]|uniref:EAL domain-containing protein n=1 Tax=Bacillus sp. 1NLA3E TaxID=666686 RepID=UPI000247EF42|nr:EAL-associated domain-containing protein [Bacillus sp. 1NLA3E]AGK52889.1 diguanylate phosphodiesterase [Bacillus sp. 1NLA3E]
MDALDIITDLDNVIPFFQPIFSADEHRVIGYEILGRYRGKTEIESLGPFFLDDQIPDEYRLEVDNTVLTKALEMAVDLEKDVLLFINRDANILMHDHGEQFLQLLMQYQEKGISMNRIVLEISERNYKGPFDHLDHLLNYYRTYGMKLAIDKVANDSSHLDRIGELAPDIIKVDLQALRSTGTGPAFQDVLYSLSLLARKIGATLLFENVEMVFQLQFAWKNGGRYYQGFYLCRPCDHFVERDMLKDRLKDECHTFIANEKRKLESLYAITENFQVRMQEFINKNRKVLDYEELLKTLVKMMDHIAFRIYICDEDGFQKTPNFFFENEEWKVQNEYLNKNWSWRPYFLENIIKMRYERKGILSDLYSDIETGETIRTFSYPVNANDYVFIDLSYSFLYQHEGLI